MLTPRQKQALDFIVGHVGARGVTPSHEEIARGLGLRSKGAVNRLLVGLRDRGFVDWRPRQARSLRLVEQARVGDLPIAPHRLRDVDRIAALHGIDRTTCLDWLLEQAVRIFDHGSLPPPREINRPEGWAS